MVSGLMTCKVMRVQDGLVPHVRPTSQDIQPPRPPGHSCPLGSCPGLALGWHLDVGPWDCTGDVVHVS